MTYTAAGMYGAAALDGVIEGLLPGDPRFAITPIVVVVTIFALLLLAGRRLPRWALALLGPLGVVLAAVALATTNGPGDVAVLYVLPVLWTSVFFGRRGAAAIVVCVGIAHALALLSLPGSESNPARWVDVMVVACAVALVVLALEQRNAALLSRLQAEARTDALTGLLNRRGFDERARLALAHTRRTGVPLAIVTFDVDHFKRVNDEWGHTVGDRVLARIGGLIATHARATDVAARMGGEEFTVLLTGSDASEAREFGARVRAAVASSDRLTTPVVRVSAGIAACRAPTDLGSCLQQADFALYEAKRTGRDRIVIYGEPADGHEERPRRAARSRLLDRARLA